MDWPTFPYASMRSMTIEESHLYRDFIDVEGERFRLVTAERIEKLGEIIAKRLESGDDSEELGRLITFHDELRERLCQVW